MEPVNRDKALDPSSAANRLLSIPWISFINSMLRAAGMSRVAQTRIVESVDDSSEPEESLPAFGGSEGAIPSFAKSTSHVLEGS